MNLAKALEIFGEEFGHKTYDWHVVKTSSAIHAFKTIEAARAFYDKCTESGVYAPESLSEKELNLRYSSEESTEHVIQHND